MAGAGRRHRPRGPRSLRGPLEPLAARELAEHRGRQPQDPRVPVAQLLGTQCKRAKVTMEEAGLLGKRVREHVDRARGRFKGTGLPSQPHMRAHMLERLNAAMPLGQPGLARQAGMSQAGPAADLPCTLTTPRQSKKACTGPAATCASAA